MLRRNGRKPPSKGFDDLYIPLFCAVGGLTSFPSECLSQTWRRVCGSIGSGLLKTKGFSGFCLCGLKLGGLCDMITLPRKVYNVVLVLFWGKKEMNVLSLRCFPLIVGVFDEVCLCGYECIVLEWSFLFLDTLIKAAKGR